MLVILYILCTYRLHGSQYMKKHDAMESMLEIAMRALGVLGIIRRQMSFFFSLYWKRPVYAVVVKLLPFNTRAKRKPKDYNHLEDESAGELYIYSLKLSQEGHSLPLRIPRKGMYSHAAG